MMPEETPTLIDLTDMAFGGDAIGRLDGEVVFVPFALPGERATIAIERRKRDYASGRVVEIVTPSPVRVEPFCPHFGACGGCQWQHCDYPTQLVFKRQVVVDQLRRIGEFAAADDFVRDTIGMLEPRGYRNHVRFSLGRKFGDLGFTYRQTRRLLPIDECGIAHEAINAVLTTAQRRCIGLAAHQIMVRYGCNTGDMLIQPRLPSVPELVSGQLTLTEQILDRTYIISAAAFFQVNTRREARSIPEAIRASWLPERNGSYSIADLLALLVLDRLEGQPDDVVLDAYCGVGTFSALLAPHVRRVVGVEESPAAIKDARANTTDLPNTRFIAAKAEHAVLGLGEDRLDAVVIDPARVGCAPAVITALLDAHPRRIVYVSCDPATLARDARLLVNGGYHLDQVEPIDMFPHTGHIESVTTLTWR